MAEPDYRQGKQTRSAEPTGKAGAARTPGRINGVPGSSYDSPEHRASHRPAMGMWEQAFGEASVPVGKLGRIQAPKGVYLRTQPQPGGLPPSAPIPFNGLVHIERRTTQAHVSQRWCYVIAADSGTAGFCEERYLAIDPPEPSAKLRATAPGERLAEIAEQAFGEPDAEINSRLQVQVLYWANRDRAGIKLDHVELGGEDRALRGDEEAQTLAIYRGAKVIAGTSLWIPSRQFLQQLKGAGIVTNGSTYASEAFDKAKGTMAAVVDGTKYVAGAVVGILEGAYSAIVDLFKGALDMIDAVLKIVWNLVTAHIGRIKDMVMSWVDKMKLAWAHRGAIADEFLHRWNASDLWARGHFQGEVAGWLMMTVLLIAITLGEEAPAAVSGMVARWPQMIQLIKAVDTLGDVTTYVGAAAKATKLPVRAVQYMTRELGRTERTVAHVADTARGELAHGAEKVAQVSEHAAEAAGKDVRKTEKKASDYITVAGYAQHPRTHPWLRNPDGAVRSVDEAVQIARSHGVQISDDILIRKIKGKMLPDSTYAQYFSRRGVDPKKLIRWDEFFDHDLDELVVRVSDVVFQSDEAIVAVFSHEMHELNELRRLFEETGGSMSMQRLHSLINPGIPRNLHDEAWDIADKLVVAMRKGAK